MSRTIVYFLLAFYVIFLFYKIGKIRQRKKFNVLDLIILVASVIFIVTAYIGLFNFIFAFGLAFILVSVAGNTIGGKKL